MLDVVRDVRQKSAARLEPLNVFERLVQTHVRWMLLETQCINHQQLQSHQPGARLIRNKVAVSHIRKAIYSKSSDRQLSVHHRHRFDVQAKKTEVTLDAVRHDSRDTGITRGLEHVRVYSPESLPGHLARVYRYRAVAKHYRARIIQPKTMIGV